MVTSGDSSTVLLFARARLYGARLAICENNANLSNSIYCGGIKYASSKSRANVVNFVKFFVRCAT